MLEAWAVLVSAIFIRALQVLTVAAELSAKFSVLRFLGWLRLFGFV